MTSDTQKYSSCSLQPLHDNCFNLLNEEEKEMLEQSSLSVVYKKGEIICKQGTFASHIIYLEKGLVKQYLEGNIKNLILTLTPEGNILGLSSIYDDSTVFPLSISTYVDSTVKIIDIKTFKNLLLNNARFAYKIINILNENTVQIQNRFFCISQKQLHGRLADIIICLSKRIFKNNRFELPLSRTDLADLTGMSTESVIRIMKDFKDDNIISISGKKIEIIDFSRLQKISEVG